MQRFRWTQPIGVALAALALGACSAERSRAVRVSEDGGGKEKDYRAMLDEARARTAAEDSLGALLTGLEKFRGLRGRMPTNLDELVTSGTITALPPPPAGMTHLYDPRSGNVRLVRASLLGDRSVLDDTYQAPSIFKQP